MEGDRRRASTTAISRRRPAFSLGRPWEFCRGSRPWAQEWVGATAACPVSAVPSPLVRPSRFGKHACTRILGGSDESRIARVRAVSLAQPSLLRGTCAAVRGLRIRLHRLRECRHGSGGAHTRLSDRSLRSGETRRATRRLASRRRRRERSATRRSRPRRPIRSATSNLPSRTIASCRMAGRRSPNRPSRRRNRPRSRRSVPGQVVALFGHEPRRLDALARHAHALAVAAHHQVVVAAGDASGQKALTLQGAMPRETDFKQTPRKPSFASDRKWPVTDSGPLAR